MELQLLQMSEVLRACLTLTGSDAILEKVNEQSVKTLAMAKKLFTSSITTSNYETTTEHQLQIIRNKKMK